MDDPQPLTDEQIREQIAAFPAAADSIVSVTRKLNGVELDYSRESLVELDRIISEMWPEKPPAMLEQMILGMGAYLGETMVRNLGGQWVYEQDYGFVIVLKGQEGEEMKSLPMNRVHKRFVNGMEDSLSFFYDKFEQAQKEGLDSIQGPGIRKFDPTDGSLIYDGNEEAPAADPESFMAAMPAMAQECVRVAGELGLPGLDYSPRSLAELDRMLESDWENLCDKSGEEMELLVGAYLGQTVVENLGAKWEHMEDLGVHVELPVFQGQAVAKFPPFIVAGEAIELAGEDADSSLFSFYQTLRSQVAAEPPSPDDLQDLQDLQDF
ncbi:MAG: hypothetical protein RLY93_07925 [Sumerlaeia bacterium]